MTLAHHASRIRRLEAHPRSHHCRECGRPIEDPAVSLPPGRLSVEEVEAHFRQLVGGELFAAWPRCRTCGQLDHQPLALLKRLPAPTHEDALQLLADYRLSREAAS